MWSKISWAITIAKPTLERHVSINIYILYKSSNLRDLGGTTFEDLTCKDEGIICMSPSMGRNNESCILGLWQWQLSQSLSSINIKLCQRTRGIECSVAAEMCWLQTVTHTRLIEVHPFDWSVMELISIDEKVSLLCIWAHFYRS